MILALKSLFLGILVQNDCFSYLAWIDNHVASLCTYVTDVFQYLSTPNKRANSAKTIKGFLVAHFGDFKHLTAKSMVFGSKIVVFWVFLSKTTVFSI